VKSRTPLALVVAAIPLLLIGADLVLFPFGDPGQMQDGIPVGLEPSIRLGTALIVAGIAVLVAGLLGFVIARKPSPASLTPSPVQTVRDSEAPPPAPSSEVEAAVVKLLHADEKLLTSASGTRTGRSSSGTSSGGGRSPPPRSPASWTGSRRWGWSSGSGAG
jgi:hypothetical protein